VLPLTLPVTQTSPTRSFNATNPWSLAAVALAAAIATTAALAHRQIAIDEGLSPVAGDTYPGFVRPRNVTTIAFPVPVTIRSVHVAVGDAVQAGQIVMELDDEEATRLIRQLTFGFESAVEERTQLEQIVAILDRSIRSLSTTLAETNAELAVAQRNADSVPSRQVKDSPSRALAAYEQAQARERRITELAAQGAVSRQDLEDARFATRVAADDLENADRAAAAATKLESLQTLQARTQADLAIADQRRQLAERKGQLEQSRMRERQAGADLQSATKRLSDLMVRAPGGSVVADVAVRAGDRLLAGVPLLRLAILDPMVVDVDVPPGRANGIQRGDAATVTIPGRSEPRSGRVVTIAPLPGEAGAHALEVEFDNPDAALFAGQSARVLFGAGSRASR
jgi:multidrug resistance efflux pump